VWDLKSGRELRTLEGHSAWVRSVALTVNGSRAVSASEDRLLKVWDIKSGRVIAAFRCNASAACCEFVNPRRIVAGDMDGRIYLVSLEASGAPRAMPSAKGLFPRTVSIWIRVPMPPA
jgi:WD40 repeat protein